MRIRFVEEQSCVTLATMEICDRMNCHITIEHAKVNLQDKEILVLVKRERGAIAYNLSKYLSSKI